MITLSSLMYDKLYFRFEALHVYSVTMFTQINSRMNGYILIDNCIFEDLNGAILKMTPDNTNNLEIPSQTMIKDSIFINNEGVSNALFVSNTNAKIETVNSLFENNTNPSRGSVGTVDKYGSVMTFTGCNFTNNSAEYGGVIYSHQESLAKFTDCITGCNFTNNSAEYGGVIYSHQESLAKFTDCKFNGNFGQIGSISYASDDGRLQMEDCVFEDNFAAEGGLFYFINAKIEGSIIATNNYVYSPDYLNHAFIVNSSLITVQRSEFVLKGR
eukprot:CAMPEP_0170567876 /NCGR_PEP_ID=MMETSP0211-20121228/80763_1 /TAXON_ID=311385 /ORGANISM="Pseudokeronopsis sp., Strain OXSARD2" /LENGTH=270 /DNA_ID=CAMNT_0010889467 /DNA_START=291 /DNA_END=1103 /DNA_ORIENTATION=-